MSTTKRIRIGLAARDLFEQIMLIKTQPSIFTTPYAPLGAGIFHDSMSTSELPHFFIAFDNIHGDCWVEEFYSINAAFDWIKNGSEAVEPDQEKETVLDEAHQEAATLEPFGIVDDSIVILLAAAGTVLLVSSVLHLIGAKT